MCSSGMNSGMGLYFFMFLGVIFFICLAWKICFWHIQKIFMKKMGPNLYIIARFLQEVPAGSQDKNDFVISKIS
jgi:hypothetical protein